MLYAGHALDQNRDVFVFPGPESDPAFSGSRELLADGATEVLCGEDILREYRDEKEPKRETVTYLFDDLLAAKQQPQAALADAAANLSAAQLTVWEALSAEATSVAELEVRTGMATSVLFSVLTELELEGLIESLPGKRYRRS